MGEAGGVKYIHFVHVNVIKTFLYIKPSRWFFWSSWSHV